MKDKDAKILEEIYDGKGGWKDTDKFPSDIKLEEIAKKYLNIDTLDERNSDELDFHEVSVWQLKKALEAAMQYGIADGRYEG